MRGLFDPFRGVEALFLPGSVSREWSSANLGPGLCGSWRMGEAEPLVIQVKLGRCHKGSETNIPCPKSDKKMKNAKTG